ncbi:hypothetical protein QR680_006697 [Steinernema hermaphroditum]|uniref:Nanos-type domain-containing protein n=1 Tax=Steinernema hermaphroditum TaxID=289476 RepID=A0AA39HXH6_9BILA|nr:hypothetical protein QR680_006697 [Steinernema hermaphroditum]
MFFSYPHLDLFIEPPEAVCRAFTGATEELAEERRPGPRHYPLWAENDQWPMESVTASAHPTPPASDLDDVELCSSPSTLPSIVGSPEKTVADPPVMTPIGVLPPGRTGSYGVPSGIQRRREDYNPLWVPPAVQHAAHPPSHARQALFRAPENGGVEWRRPTVRGPRCTFCFVKKVRASERLGIPSPDANDPAAAWNCHMDRDATGRAICWALRNVHCEVCGATGDFPHVGIRCPFLHAIPRQLRERIIEEAFGGRHDNRLRRRAVPEEAIWLPDVI